MKERDQFQRCNNYFVLPVEINLNKYSCKILRKWTAFDTLFRLRSHLFFLRCLVPPSLLQAVLPSSPSSTLRFSLVKCGDLYMLRTFCLHLSLDSMEEHFLLKLLLFLLSILDSIVIIISPFLCSLQDKDLCQGCSITPALR